MASELPVNGSIERAAGADFNVKAGLARMLKGGVIMDVVNAEQVHFPITAGLNLSPITAMNNF